MGLPKIKKMSVNHNFLNSEVVLPYGLKIEEVVKTMESVYEFLFELNSFLINKGYSPFEDMVLGNTYSGVLSEIIVTNLAKSSNNLVKNQKIGGHPDLLPADNFDIGASILKANRGIEVKTSKQKSSWQGHNPEEGWYMIFRYHLHEENIIAEIPTFEFAEVMISALDLEDWSFSGRKGNSRRTPTASILMSGTRKLRENYVYRNPNVA